MRSHSVVPVLVLLVGLVIPAPARAGTPPILEDERLEEVKAEVAAVFEKVDEGDLPEALFVAKVREGLVKKVEAKKIVVALEKLEGRCSRAKQLISSSGLKPVPSSIGHMADLLAKGLSDKDGARLLKEFAKAKAGTALLDKGLVAAIMMTDKGLGTTQAVDKVLSILKKGGSKGLESWIKTAYAKGYESEGKSKDSKAKGKKGPKKPKGKAPGKSSKPHGK